MAKTRIIPPYRLYVRMCKTRGLKFAPLRWILLCLLTIVVAFVMICTVMSARVDSGRRRYPSDRYRKVVKEGVFWDSVEYHER